MASNDTYMSLDDLTDIDITLMTLRKPTELKKVIDSIPKPERAVPKNGLPVWYRLGLESKLSVPKMPEGKIVFSRGKIGEDVRRLGLGGSGPQPTFDLTDPYCYSVSYDYVPMHDPHLANHFSQKPARNRMKSLGFCTKDNRAVCSLKEFNLYRKYLYNQYMDQIHMEMKRLDERAKDDLMLKRVEGDVARRLLVFNRSERAREHLERSMKEHADEWAEKKRRAKEQEQKVKARMKYLAEFNEKQRTDRANRYRDRQNRIKQRVQAAAEMELRRKITMVRQWRINEKKRLNRVRQDMEAKQRKKEDDANRKWTARVAEQNRKIEEQALLLKLYTDDASASARRREKRAEIYAYNTDLQLQRIRLANWKLLHGGDQKAASLVRKMGQEFEKSKRGAKGMSPELAHRLAIEGMATALSNQGDPLMTLGQARARMDIQVVLPSAPVKLLEEMLENAIIDFTRRRCHLLLRDVERVVYSRAAEVFFQSTRPSVKKGPKKPPRWSIQVVSQLAKEFVNVDEGVGGSAASGGSICFGEVVKYAPEDFIDVDLKRTRDRPPSPVPSRTKLAEVTFSDRVEDLPDPVTFASYLPERRQLLELINNAAKLLSRNVSAQVKKGMDVNVGKVTLPCIKHKMDWGEAVEGLSDAVVNKRVHSDCGDIRRTSQFLTYRILLTLLKEMKLEKEKIRLTTLLPSAAPESELEELSENYDFYVPEEAEDKLVLEKNK